MKAGRFLEVSNALHKYSARIPKEILVTPKPIERIEINIVQPETKSS